MKVQNNHMSGNFVIRVAKPMLFDGTSLISNDIETIVEKLNVEEPGRFAVLPIHDYPKGKTPQTYLMEYLKVLEDCLANTTPNSAFKLHCASLGLRDVVKMGDNAYVGAAGQKLRVYWENEK